MLLLTSPDATECNCHVLRHPNSSFDFFIVFLVVCENASEVGKNRYILIRFNVDCDLNVISIGSSFFRTFITFVFVAFSNSLLRLLSSFTLSTRSWISVVLAAIRRTSSTYLIFVTWLATATPWRPCSTLLIIVSE